MPEKRSITGSKPAVAPGEQHAWMECINPDCGFQQPIGENPGLCPKCGELMDVRYDWDKKFVPPSLDWFENKYSTRRNPLHFSGVWRFKELFDFAPDSAVVTIGEGQTLLRPAGSVHSYVGIKPGGLFLQYEGLNPSGSFKDNGMAGAFTHARMIGAGHAACASTGNTSASMAAYARAGSNIECTIFIGEGKIAMGKLSQALDYGGRTLQIVGGFFDDAMKRVQEATDSAGLYLVNSINPFRLEGQKTIMYRILEAFRWEVPDWIVCPGGNLGNSSAFGKAFQELYELGLIDRKPRLAIINSAGAPTLNVLVNEKGLEWNGGRYDRQVVRDYWKWMDDNGIDANTIASAIEINRPVNLSKALRSLDYLDGVVRAVSDEEILDAKAQVGRQGIGCEPASAASVAGVKRLVEEGVIDRDARVACVLTGHQLKDPKATVGYHSAQGGEFDKIFAKYGVKVAHFPNRPIPVPNDLEAILRRMRLSSDED